MRRLVELDELISESGMNFDEVKMMIVNGYVLKSRFLAIYSFELLCYSSVPIKSLPLR